MSTTLSQTLGYPRMGPQRELKRTLETFWSGRSDEASLLESAQAVERHAWAAQSEAGIDRIGVGDFSLYDPVLDWALRFGAIPPRFSGRGGLDLKFAMARGEEGVPALELTKWFDTNYHYLVPEIDAGWKPIPDFADYLESIQRAAEILGERAVPVILGPFTFLRLSRLAIPLPEVLPRLLPLYEDLLSQVRRLRPPIGSGPGFAEVQIHEPALILPPAADDRQLYTAAYDRLSQVGLPIQLVTYFDDLGDSFAWASRLPVAGIGLDFTRGDNLTLLRRHGWPKETVLSAGVVDARNIWRVDPAKVLSLLDDLQPRAPLRVSPSSSLQFVPDSVALETALPESLRTVLAFAKEKLAEVRTLAAYLSGERDADLSSAAWDRFRSEHPGHPALHDRIQTLQPGDFERTLPFSDRRPLQIPLPPFPTTTIGSFPQTREIRALRRSLKDGNLDPEGYRAGIDAAIEHVIRIQQDIGLDVLVHGEFERSDMVEYFAEQLEGFAVTEHGWVQSYGSRCVRPPIIYGDISRHASLTVREFTVAQAAAARPVKGMLTGPVTILNWSYPRSDLARGEIAFQIALALREEIADLEAAGARAIQVDEPALREGLPLRPARRAEYLRWAVDAFRLATAGARPETQIHTHMCYGDFGDILPAIDELDADVISLENARSGDETLADLARYGYRREVGPGLYDVHSPAVLPVESARAKLRMFLGHLGAEQLWVNPDCGLKTRNWPEVEASLRNLVQAAKLVREEMEVAQR